MTNKNFYFYINKFIKVKKLFQEIIIALKIVLKPPQVDGYKCTKALGLIALKELGKLTL